MIYFINSYIDIWTNYKNNFKAVQNLYKLLTTYEIIHTHTQATGSCPEFHVQLHIICTYSYFILLYYKFGMKSSANFKHYLYLQSLY